MNDLEKRIERLERSIGRWRIAGISAIVAVFAVIAFGAAQAKFTDSTGFRVINSTGAAQGAFSLDLEDDAGASMVLQGKDGSRAILTSSQVAFFDAAGHIRVNLILPSAEVRAKYKAEGLRSDDKPSLTFYDAKGKASRIIE